ASSATRAARRTGIACTTSSAWRPESQDGSVARRPSASGWRSPARRRGAGWPGTWSELACGDEVAGHKPAPDVYVLALRRLGVVGSRAVAVEDTVHGVAAARAAGLRCIAIPNPFADRSRFGEADLVLASAAEMPLRQALSHLRRGV